MQGVKPKSAHNKWKHGINPYDLPLLILHWLHMVRE